MLPLAPPPPPPRWLAVSAPLDLPSTAPIVAAGLTVLLSLSVCSHRRSRRFRSSLRTPSLHHPTSRRFRIKRRKEFPPPYPNGWYHVCNSTDVAGGRVHSISALGLDLVAFREELSGRVGVLSAFCPHLGAHLGEGGTVVGDSLRCPFHGWQFDAAGACVKVPYSRLETVPSRCRTSAYDSREALGMIFVWFDAEGRPPAYELRQHADVAAAGSGYRLVSARSSSFEMHVCEMVENSADPFHFQTLHGPLPIPLLSKVIGCTHVCKQSYPELPPERSGEEPNGATKEQRSGAQRADGECLPHECIFDDAMVDFRLLGAGTPSGGISLCKWVFGLRAFLRTITTRVTFEGPSLISFEVWTPLGRLRLLQTLLPLAPFTQHVESRWYAPRYFPTPVAIVFARIAARALEQDRGVWESKLYRKQPLLVSGDGPFPAFRRWWAQFYSESSDALGRDDLAW